MFAELVLASSLCTLRQNRKKQWARKNIKYLDVRWGLVLAADAPRYLDLLACFQECRNIAFHNRVDHSFLYILFGPQVEYIGRGVLLRTGDVRGFVGRLFDHCLAVARPTSDEGASRRAKLLRSSTRWPRYLLSMLPITCGSFEQICAAESVTIRSAKANANATHTSR